MRLRLLLKCSRAHEKEISKLAEDEAGKPEEENE